MFSIGDVRSISCRKRLLVCCVFEERFGQGIETPLKLNSGFLQGSEVRKRVNEVVSAWQKSPLVFERSISTQKEQQNLGTIMPATANGIEVVERVPSAEARQMSLSTQYFDQQYGSLNSRFRSNEAR